MTVFEIILLTLNPIIFLTAGIALGYQLYPNIKEKLTRKAKGKKITELPEQKESIMGPTPAKLSDDKSYVGPVKPITARRKRIKGTPQEEEEEVMDEYFTDMIKIKP